MTQKDNVGIALPPEQIEAALRESEQRLRWLASIIESSDDAIVSKNLDGVITRWNGGAERIFGYSASEANLTVNVDFIDVTPALLGCA